MHSCGNQCLSGTPESLLQSPNEIRHSRHREKYQGMQQTGRIALDDRCQGEAHADMRQPAGCGWGMRVNLPRSANQSDQN